MRVRTSLFVTTALISAGCANYQTYQADSSQPQASLIVSVNNDSAKDTTIRRVGVFAFDTCNTPGRRLALINPKESSTAESGEVRLTAGRPMTLSVIYSDARFAENRSCATTATFSPRPDVKYLADLQVDRSASTCTLRLIDRSSGAELKEPEIIKPDMACTGDPKAQLANGVGIIHNYKITVVLPAH